MTSRLRPVLFGLCLGLGYPALAHAQDAAPAPLSETLSGEAHQAYDAGKLLFADGDAAGAIAKFRHAYDLSKDARLLWNMAVCEKQLRHYASAARLVTLYLSEAKLTAENRQDATSTLDALRAFYSDLTLVNVPAGASVSIDGTGVGTAPFSGPIPVDLGRRHVHVEREGFEPLDRQLDVPGATPVSLDVTLTAVSNSASLSVTSNGDGDLIAIDGKVLGRGHYQGTLPAGEHVIRVTASGKTPYESHVQLIAKGSRDLQVNLQDEHKGKVLWPWIAGGAALVVGATIGGYFLFKPADEPGKAPQGKLGTIYLPAAFGG